MRGAMLPFQISCEAPAGRAIEKPASWVPVPTILNVDGMPGFTTCHTAVFNVGLLKSSEIIVPGGRAFTVNAAVLLVALPAALETTHRNVAPLSAKVVGGVTYVALVAPSMSVPFFCHRYANSPVPLADT